MADMTDAANDAIKRALAEAGTVDLSWISPPPAADGWTLAPDALRLVMKIVETLRPRHILELGSGLSTRVLSRAAGRLAEECVISSVDHDPQYNWATGGAKQEPGGARVEFHLAPLVVREFGGKLLGAYLIQPAKLAATRPVDLVVIDGPPVNLGGREGTLYQVMDFARAGTVVLLDDSTRPEERAAIKAWRDNLGDAISVEQLPGFGKGMAAVAIHKPVPVAELWRHRFTLTRAEIERIVPADVGVILAGESWWGNEVGLSRPTFPLMEKDGQYWGEPADDAAAMAEVERLRARGAWFVVFGWHTFWWLGHYRAFVASLGAPVLENDRVVMFDLRGRS
jgi:hypothetical protein